MKTAILSTIVALGIGFSGSLFAAQNETQVSPSAINLSAKRVEEITIHTEVRNSCVDTDSLSVSVNFGTESEDLVIDGTFSDNQGHLVIKIDSDDFKYKVAGFTGEALFEMSGSYDDDNGCSGDTFDGSDMVRIIDNSGN